MPEQLPIDTSIEAEYEDGYIHSETELNDACVYAEAGNTFTDILNRLPEADHGRMVRFSCFWKDQRYDADFRSLPENARPIRFRHGYNTLDATTGSIIESGFSGVDFGFQYNNPDGKNVKEVMELR